MLCFSVLPIFFESPYWVCIAISILTLFILKRFFQSNAILATENHFAKTAAKPAGAAPPATPLEKYRLRISVGKQTGRMDLACKSVWPDEGLSRQSSHNSSVAHSPKARAAPSNAGLVDSTDNGDADSANGAFLTQDGEEVRFNTTEVEAEAELAEESPEGLFDQVSTSRDDPAGASLAVVEVSANGEAVEGKKSAPGAKRRAKEMLLDFRLSVIPREVLKFTGKNIECCVYCCCSFPHYLGATQIFLFNPTFSHICQ